MWTETNFWLFFLPVRPYCLPSHLWSPILMIAHPAVSTEALDGKGASLSTHFPRKTCLLDLGQEQNQRSQTSMIPKKCRDSQGSYLFFRGLWKAMFRSLGHVLSIPGGQVSAGSSGESDDSGSPVTFFCCCLLSIPFSTFTHYTGGTREFTMPSAPFPHP